MRDFDASFEILIAGGSSDPDDPAQLSYWSRGFEPLSGMGLAFCYAPLDNHVLWGASFGEKGPDTLRYPSQSFVGPRGLRVSLLTYTSRVLEVTYENRTLARVLLGSDLRTLSWTPMRIRYVATSNAADGSYKPTGGGGLTVWYDGVERISNLTIPDWAPDRNWSWSLSSSTADATDVHWVDNLAITSANLSLSDAFPVALTLNRREHYPTDAAAATLYNPNGAVFAYAPPPALSRVLPVGGPRAGGTVVTIYGVNLNNGTHYKCRWGGAEPQPVLGGRVLHGPVPGSLPLEQYMTHATYVGPVAMSSESPAPFAETAQYRQLLRGGAVTCVSPNVTAIAEGTVSLELSLNGQEYTRSGLNFTRYAPVITSVYPLTGPRSGGFRIELGGTDLTAGSAYRCRFELPPEAAAWAGGLGGWPSPPPPLEMGSGEVGSGEAGSNSSGSAGGRRLSAGSNSSSSGAVTSAHATGSGTAPAYIVVPAQLVRNATAAGRTAPHDAIVCRVPSHATLPINTTSGELHVSVSLNAQQYSSRVELDTWWPPSTARLDLYAAPTAVSVSPSSGPALGGTRITVSGTNLTGGSNYTCKFGDSAFVPRSRTPLALSGTLGSFGDHVRCLSPPFELKPCFTPSMACDPKPARVDFLDIAPNGQDYIPRGSSYVPFVRFREPILRALSPNTGPSAGGTLLTLTGVNPTLSGGSDYRCRYEGVAVVPSQPSPPSVPQAEASSGDASSGEVGSGGGGLRLGNRSTVAATTPASFDSAHGVVHCYTPPLAETSATLAANFSVSLNGQQYHASTEAGVPHIVFDFFGAPTLSAVSPACGPTGGGTRITITGEQLGRGSHYLCRFGERIANPRVGLRPLRVDATTAAHYDTSLASVWCLTPPGLHTLPSLFLDVSLNGQESTMSPLRILRYRPPALYSISPASGPSDGNTVVTVTGNHSLAELHACDVRCAFGSRGASIVPGTVPSTPGASGTFGPTGTVRCLTPPNVPAGPLEISLNGQQFTYTDPNIKSPLPSPPHPAKTNVYFAPYPPLAVNEVLPPIGLDSGNTTVLLPMSNLSSPWQVGTDLRCRFGSEARGSVVDVPASYYHVTPSAQISSADALTLPFPLPSPITPLSHLLSTVMPPSLPPPLSPTHFANGVLTCVSPSRAMGVDELRVTLNGQQFSPPARYDVFTSPRVLSFYPLSTPEHGGVTITVNGEGFAAATVAAAVEPSSGEPASNSSSSSSHMDVGSGGVDAASGSGSSGALDASPPSYDPELLRCRIGATTVRATR